MRSRVLESRHRALNRSSNDLFVSIGEFKYSIHLLCFLIWYYGSYRIFISSIWR